MDNASDFNQLKQSAEKYYSSIKEQHCPALEAKVHFTSEGFNHLRYSRKKARSQVDQIAKFKLLTKATLLIHKTTTIQEYSERHEEIHKKRYKKISKEWSWVGYWGFIGIIGGTRVKVVVKRIDNGPYLFWSVIPVWQTKELMGSKVTDRSTGDLTED